MSTAADKLMALHGIKADLFAATREKGLDTTGRTLENLHELWGGISGGGALQAKTAVPSNVDVEVTPDDGYAALSAVNIAAALNLKPWNIRKGKTLFGVAGTADIAVTTEVPSDIPVNKDDADTAYEEAVGSAPKDEDGNDLDMMTLADDNGNITYGYFLQGAANGSANGTCLYNGVELPDINAVWTDKETYPYAVIVPIEGVTVVHFTSAVTYSNSNFGDYPVGTAYTLYVLENNSWRFVDEGVTDTEISDTPTSAIIWTSHDILNTTDGTVYLAASDPIPLDYNTIIRWDGNTEGRVTFDLDDYTSLVKVSDYVMSADEMRNCVIGVVALTTGAVSAFKAAGYISDGTLRIDEKETVGYTALSTNVMSIIYVMSLEFGEETGTYILANKSDVMRVNLLAYNPASPSGFTITTYDPSTTNFAAVGWRRLSYHTTGELAGQWTYDDFSTTASSGGNFLKNIIQCSREKLYYNGAEVWPNPDQSAITAEEVTT